MRDDNIYTIDEILQEAETLFLFDSINFFKKRDYKKIREEAIYVALFLKGQKKYYAKEYKIKMGENPDCIAIDRSYEKNNIGFEVMVINKYNLDNNKIGSEMADFIFNKKGLNNYGDNCYLLIPIIKEGIVDINLTDLQQSIIKYKNKGYFKYKDIFIIFWKSARKIQSISLFKDFNDLNYQI
jgi:hypothetical protein